MNTKSKTAAPQDRRTLLSTLWIFVLVNMIFADIFSFMNAEFLQGLLTGYAEQVEITTGLLLIVAIMTEIPIAMIFLSRVLPHKANRWANVIAGVFTIVYVIGGGSAKPHYVFIASIEVATLLFIIWYAWTWSQPE